MNGFKIICNECKKEIEIYEDVYADEIKEPLEPIRIQLFIANGFRLTCFHCGNNAEVY